MEPLQETTLHSSSRDASSTDDSDAVSALTSHMQVEARSLHEITGPNIPDTEPSITPQGPPQVESSASQADANEISPESSVASNSSHDRRPPYAPTVSSPLNPNSSAQAKEGQLNGEAVADGDAKTIASSHPSGKNGVFPNTRRKEPPLRPLSYHSQRRPNTPGRELDHAAPPSQQTTPMTVRDLGSDYTRYFNPFSDSPRSSFVELPSVYTPTINSQSPSNNRNPFASSMDTLPGIETSPQINQARPFSPFLDDRLAAPFTDSGGYKFPMFLDEKEADDDMHMPQDDDDLRYKPKLKDHFNRESLTSTIGLFLMLLGILTVFIVLPVLSSTGILRYDYAYDTPLDQMPNYQHKPEPWRIVNDLKYPLLQNIRRGLIDPLTPKSAYTSPSADGEELELVFSDEFNKPNRTFYPGDDPYWFAPDIWYGATQDLDWYDPDAVTTWDGTLELRLDKFFNHNLNFRSGMLNSWNQLCFKGGRFEVSVSLPGPAGVMGFWPGVWTMGNLGRPGYLATTDGMWPYTYNECDAGITPNQSMTDGTSKLPGQRLTSCSCPGADHPTPGTGRGAPEIDILEASASYSVHGLPVITQSYQVAPFDIWYYPDYNFTAFPDYSTSFTNTYTGGPYQQAISGTTALNKGWFDGQAYQKYAFEYTPGTGANGNISWFVGDQMVFLMDGRAIGPNGNVGARQVSQEPMSIVLNLGLSNNWVAIDWANLVFPAVMRVDYVRWYQRKGHHSVTCDPPGYETTEYIRNHMEAYTNPNLTHWNQTSYEWPSNTLTSDC